MIRPPSAAAQGPRLAARRLVWALSLLIGLTLLSQLLQLADQWPWALIVPLVSLMVFVLPSVSYVRWVERVVLDRATPEDTLRVIAWTNFLRWGSLLAILLLLGLSVAAVWAAPLARMIFVLGGATSPMIFYAQGLINVVLLGHQAAAVRAVAQWQGRREGRREALEPYVRRLAPWLRSAQMVALLAAVPMLLDFDPASGRLANFLESGLEVALVVAEVLVNEFTLRFARAMTDPDPAG